MNFLRTWQSGFGSSSGVYGSIKKNIRCDENDDKFEYGNSPIKSEQRFDEKSLKRPKCGSCDRLSISRESKRCSEKKKQNDHDGKNRKSCKETEAIVNNQNDKESIGRGSRKVTESSIMHNRNSKTLSRLSNFSNKSGS